MLHVKLFISLCSDLPQQQDIMTEVETELHKTNNLTKTCPFVENKKKSHVFTLQTFLKESRSFMIYLC